MTEKSLFLTPKCFGLHIEPNVYIPVAAAENEEDKRFNVLKEALLKHFPELAGKIKIINFADFKEDKLFYFEDQLLGYPIITESKHKPLNFFLVG